VLPDRLKEEEEDLPENPMKLEEEDITNLSKQTIHTSPQ